MPTVAERLASLARLDLARHAGRVPHVPDIRVQAIAARLGRPVRVTVVRLDGIGDWVLSFPVLTALVRAPEVEAVTVVAPAGLQGLFAKAPIERFVASAVPTILAPPPPGGFLGRARAAGFPAGRAAMREGAAHAAGTDMVILPRWDADLGINARAWALGTRHPIVGYSPASVPSATRRERREVRLLSRPITNAVPASHEIEHARVLVRALGLNDEVSDGFGAEILGVPVSHGGVAPGRPVVLHTTSNEPKRQWSQRHWRVLMERVLDETDLDVVLVGSTADVSRIDDLRDGLGDRVRAAAGRPLGELPELLASAAAFVGNDSGPAHLAGSIGLPTVVISPHPRDGDAAHRNSPVRFAPWGTRVRVLQPPTGLGGCRASCTARVPHCIDVVEPSDVFGALCALLEQG